MKESSIGRLAAPTRFASRRHAATSVNSPAVSDFRSCHGNPSARRPNHRNGRPSRACNPAARAPAEIGRTGCSVTTHSMSASGCGASRSFVRARLKPGPASMPTGKAAPSPPTSEAIRFCTASGGSYPSSSPPPIAATPEGAFSGTAVDPSPGANDGSMRPVGDAVCPPSRDDAGLAPRKACWIRRRTRRSWIQL